MVTTVRTNSRIPVAANSLISHLKVLWNPSSWDVFAEHIPKRCIFFLFKSSPALSISNVLCSSCLEFNKPPCSSSDLFNYCSFIHFSHQISHSIIQFTLFLHSPLSLSLLHRLLPFIHLSLSLPFLISNSLPLPNSHSYPSVCLPFLPHSISPSFSLCLSFYLLATGNGFFPDPGGWRGVLTVPNKEVTVWILQKYKEEKEGR